MPDAPLTRRVFVSAAAAAGAAQQAGAQTPATPVTANQPQATLKSSGSLIRVLTLNKFEPGEIEQIRKTAAPAAVEIVIAANRDEFRQKLRDADVVYGDLRAADLDYAPKVKWVQSGGAGVENMDPKFRESPIVLTNMARTFAPAISETGMGLLLCLTRGITTYYMPQFYKRQMNPIGTVKSADHIELAGLKMGIVGMGGIGTAVARRAYYGFDMRIVGTDARPVPAPEYVEEIRDPSWFEQMATEVDVLVSAAPHTPQTERMFNEKIFRSMKKTAYFLGLSRGKLFDDMALVKALQEKWIAGAGLDVFPQEPPPSNHPIYDCKNVVMTAHTSGWSPDRQKRLIALFADNVRRYAIGAPLVNVVDKKAGY